MREEGECSPGMGTILIIDDNELSRELLVTFFQDEYKIRQAADGKEGLDILLENPGAVCAVLLDVVMPVMDGIAVVRKMKELDLVKKIPVFLITGEEEQGTWKEAYDLGVMDVIQKPVMSYIVKRRVNSVVELFQARRGLRSQVEEQQDQILRQAKEIFNLNMGMLEALAAAIEFRSEESGDHVRRISHMTKHMLEHTPLGEGLDQNSINYIALAAIMHDVGKIAIPDAILNKPGRLTAEEFEIMKTHTVKGEALLEQIPQLRENTAYSYACDIARHHHERWDGKGYPDGLKGDEISIWSQIVSLVDVYDALVSKRVYKEAYDQEKAVEMIMAGQCGAFNPVLLEFFLQEEKELRALY